VRHVDDAHQAERDGQADRGDEEDGGQAQAAKGGPEEVAPPEMVLDRHHRAVGGLARFLSELRRGRGGVLFQLLEKVQGSHGPHLGEGADGGHAHDRIGIDELREGDGLAQGALHVGGLFPGHAAFEERDVGRVLFLAEFDGGIAPHLGIGIGEGAEIEGGLDRFPDRGTGVHRGQVRGGEQHGCALGVFDEFAVGQPEALGLAIGVGLRVEQEGNLLIVGFEDKHGSLPPRGQGLGDEGIGCAHQTANELNLVRRGFAEHRLDELGAGRSVRERDSPGGGVGHAENENRQEAQSP
jgi:hypothetical protein